MSTAPPVEVTLLLADDHSLIRAGMRSQLEMLGCFRILEAWDAASLESVLLREPHIDLALIDIMMPGMSTWQASFDFCARHARLPVLIVTGLDPTPFVARFQSLVNVRGLITKQHSASALRSVVDLALAGHPVWTNAALASAQPIRSAPGAPFGQGSNPRPAKRPVNTLTPRLHQVACLVADGLRNAEIARQLGLSEGTVKNYIKEIFNLVGVSNRTQLALKLQHAKANPMSADFGESG